MPIVVCIGFGLHAIWVTGYWKTLWWVMPACWLVAWTVARFWTDENLAAKKGVALEPSKHWDQRDLDAAEIVNRKQQTISSLDPAKLSDPHYYLSEAQELASEIAAFYHDPITPVANEKDTRLAAQEGLHVGAVSSTESIDSLTVVEVAAAARLAIDDLEKTLLETIPGSRLVTIRQWRRLTTAPSWYRSASKLYWAGSILLNPANLLKYGSSKVTIEPVVGKLQSELIATIYLKFLRQVGFYLIEMNSGRLRGGADLYRQTFSDTLRQLPLLESRSLCIAVVGQSGAGKSSLINAILGAPSAEVDVLPGTDAVQRFRHHVAVDQRSMADRAGWVSGEVITLLDTPGYGAARSSAQVTELQTVLKQADIVLLVCAANRPARKLDDELLEHLATASAEKSLAKKPPVLTVLTHIDLLPPATVWSPPYQWDSPTEAKEEQIKGAVDYCAELFGERTRSTIPVCTSEDSARQWGVAEHLLPALINNLADGQAVSLIRGFEERVDSRRLQTVLSQVRTASSSALQGWIDERWRNTGSNK